MRRIALTLTLALFLGPPFSAVAQDIPDFLPSKRADREQPFWISAAMAVPGGQIRRELFSDIAWSGIEPGLEHFDEIDLEKAARHPSFLDEYECNAFSIMAGSTRPVPFEETFEAADVVVLGKISGEAAGFLGGHPATLFEIEVEEWVKSPEAFSGLEKIYFKYEAVKILVGHRIVCHHSRRSPVDPEVGSRVLLMTSAVIHEDPLVLLPSDAQLFFETSDGSASLPGMKETFNPPSWKFVTGLLEEARDDFVTGADGFAVDAL